MRGAGGRGGGWAGPPCGPPLWEVGSSAFSGAKDADSTAKVRARKMKRVEAYLCGNAPCFPLLYPGEQSQGLPWSCSGLSCQGTHREPPRARAMLPRARALLPRAGHDRAPRTPPKGSDACLFCPLLCTGAQMGDWHGEGVQELLVEFMFEYLGWNLTKGIDHL